MAFLYGSNYFGRYCRALFPLQLCLFFAPVILFSQQYNFTNYSVEQGLVQSQAQDIIQDKQGFIWIASLGGASRFDGFEFHNYAKKEGLLSLLTFRLFAGDTNYVWFGTQDGIQRYDGAKFETVQLPAKLKSTSIKDITENKQGQVYFRTAAGQVLTMPDNHTATPVFKFENNFISAIASDAQRNVYAAVYKHGIYRFINNEWQQQPGLLENDTTVYVQKLFFDHAGKLYLLSTKGLYTDRDGILALLIPKTQIGSILTCMAEDARGRIWVGTTKGCYTITGESVSYVGAAAGLTDNSINKIIKDREGNCWFATDGDGIYKLTESPVSYLNNAHGLKGNVAMGIAEAATNKTWVGTSEGGLQLYDGNTFKTHPIPSVKAESQKINSLLHSSANELWVGTLGGGLWLLKDNQYKEIFTEKGNAFKEVISIYEDNTKTLWVCSGAGVFYFENGTMHKAEGINHPCFSVIQTGKDTMLAGSVHGLWQITGKTNASLVSVPGIDPGTVNCFTHWKNYLLLGTEDRGIVFWNRTNGKTFQCSSATGLSGDFIFSLYCDASDNVFAGTGHGISKIQISPDFTFTVKNFSSSSHPFGPECNLNAVHPFNDGSIWFGTTKGILVYNPGDTIATPSAPLIYLTDVTLVSKNGATASAKDVMATAQHKSGTLTLSHNNNHLGFDFTGLYFTNPGSLQYRYMLEGADAGYAPLSTARKVIYADLPPGNYRFKAIAVTDENIVSANSIDFAFSISAPFYQTTWFTVLSVLMLIAAGVLIQRIRTRLKLKRQAAIEKMRVEEQQKIQERTAEDLHDDLGNKITRIAVLADLLQTKLDKTDTEKRRLVDQIKENTQSLYLGTKDIIRALAPGNDNLFDLLDRCSAFGIALFEDTGIVFNTDGLQEDYKQIKVSFIFSRNLLMVIKEAMNNILKHSGTTEAVLQIRTDKKAGLTLLLSDNGKGFDSSSAAGGNGIENMKRRIARIGGTITIESSQPAGTTIKLFFQLK